MASSMSRLGSAVEQARASSSADSAGSEASHEQRAGAGDVAQGRRRRRRNPEGATGSVCSDDSSNWDIQSFGNYMDSNWPAPKFGKLAKAGGGGKPLPRGRTGRRAAGTKSPAARLAESKMAPRRRPSATRSRTTSTYHPSCLRKTDQFPAAQQTSTHRSSARQMPKKTSLQRQQQQQQRSSGSNNGKGQVQLSNCKLRHNLKSVKAKVDSHLCPREPKPKTMALQPGHPMDTARQELELMLRRIEDDREALPPPPSARRNKPAATARLPERPRLHERLQRAPATARFTAMEPPFAEALATPRSTRTPPTRKTATPPCNALRRSMRKQTVRPPPAPAATPTLSARHSQQSPEWERSLHRRVPQTKEQPERSVPLAHDPQALPPAHRTALVNLLSCAEKRDQAIIDMLNSKAAANPAPMMLHALPVALQPGESPYSNEHYLKQQQQAEAQMQLQDDRLMLDFIEAEIQQQRQQLPSNARVEQALRERAELELRKQQVREWRVQRRREEQEQRERAAEQHRLEQRQQQRELHLLLAMQSQQQQQMQREREEREARLAAARLRLQQQLQRHSDDDQDQESSNGEATGASEDGVDGQELASGSRSPEPAPLQLEDNELASEQEEDEHDSCESQGQSETEIEQSNSIGGQTTPRPIASTLDTAEQQAANETASDAAVQQMLDCRAQFKAQCLRSSFYNDPHDDTPWKLYANVATSLSNSLAEEMDDVFNHSIASFISNFIDTETRL